MDASQRYSEYHNNSISTSSQGKLIVMMYEGAIRFITQAITCMEKKDISGQGNRIQKAYDIVNELSLALNMDEGAEVSLKLHTLYQFILKQLTLANIKSDPKALASALEILSTLKEGWDQVLDYKDAGDPPGSPGTLPKNFATKC